MVKKYICPQCDYEFATRQSLWKHKQKQRCHGQSAGRKQIFGKSYIAAEPMKSITYSDAAAVKEISVKHRLTNLKIQSLLDEIY